MPSFLITKKILIIILLLTQVSIAYALQQPSNYNTQTGMVSTSDQCDWTSQCKVKWPKATVCRNKEASDSFCMCGEQRCDKVDQCDWTSHCKAQWPTATSCRNKEANDSFCMCGNKRCDETTTTNSSNNSSAATNVDQCNWTSQCKSQWPTATSCRNKETNDSFCMCGNKRCDETAPPNTSEPSKNNQLRPGDPGVKFDTSKLDPDYKNLMLKWQTAGAIGGIPLLKNELKRHRISLSGGTSDDINQAINNVAKYKDANGKAGGIVYLYNGDYIIDKPVNLKSHVSIIGESRQHVHAIISSRLKKNGAFQMKSIRNAGIYQISIKGEGNPKYDWNFGMSNNLELKNNENMSIFIKDSINCWIDAVNIKNSYDFPLRIAANHITMRDLNIDGVFNKAGGAHGYLFILGGYNLLTQSTVTRLRHISLQGPKVEYNVVYDNHFKQEVSFHAGDNGHNLIEKNKIYLPVDMPAGQKGIDYAPHDTVISKLSRIPDYRCIMGPWSSNKNHINSKRENYIWNNDCIQYNHGGTTPLSGKKHLYTGPLKRNTKGQIAEDNWYKNTNIPIGGTLYPVILN